jgi:hypothetical protein
MTGAWYTSLSQGFILGRGESFSMWAEKSTHISDQGLNQKLSEWESSAFAQDHHKNHI